MNSVPLSLTMQAGFPAETHKCIQTLRNPRLRDSGGSHQAQVLGLAIVFTASMWNLRDVTNVMDIKPKDQRSPRCKAKDISIRDPRARFRSPPRLTLSVSSI